MLKHRYPVYFCAKVGSLNLFSWICNSVQICYFFYKNITFGLTLFYFEAFAGFSGQSVYDDWYMLLFNAVLTSLPVISLGVFEQDVSSEVCLHVSSLIKFRFKIFMYTYLLVCLNLYSHLRDCFTVSSIVSARTQKPVL